ncbi:MAG: glycogen synthase GlgA [Mariprofundaceae bacterium]
MSQLHIVFIASEAAPLAKTGGLADVAGALPQALQHLKQQVTVIMPYYRQHIDAATLEITKSETSIEMWADGVERHCPIHTTTVDGLNFILIEQDDLYNRAGIYGPPGGAYDDNLLRYVLFDRVALEAAARLPHQVDIIHCHDWQTGLVPLLLKTQYQHHPNIAQAKTVYTIHNLAYQGVFSSQWLGRLGLPTHHFHPDGFEFHEQINCMKAGIFMADSITTVSPNYAKEILTSEYGCELEGFLQQNQHKLTGIVNGLDIQQWDPATDPALPSPYGDGNIHGKKQCKHALQQHCGFKSNPKTPLLTIISRLADQKGIDLLITNISKWMSKGYQLVILGSGDPHSEQQLSHLAELHPEQCYFYRGFNEGLARQIYAGGDIFLMPSRFEPCGLGQLMAMRYGNIPVVRATGGLSDTVTPYHHEHATGFHFEHACAEAFDACVEHAVHIYQDGHIWSQIRKQALKRDSSWDASAVEYQHLYQQLLNK